MMQRKSQDGNETEKRYQFQSAFPMEETMQRLHDRLGSIKGELFFLKKYKISSEKRPDSIEFEIVKRPARYRHKLVLTGTIRDTYENRSALECQVKGNDPVQHTVLWALPLFLVFLCSATYRDGIQFQDALLPSLVVTVVVLFALAPKRFPALGADDIAHIESVLGHREIQDHRAVKSKAKPAPD